ncbi:imidazoleglycerol-phosphate dehydratase HisB [Ethanoligenens harbinense]|uniref:Imidazoleglycerol-phosphate dehydratase n=1 Tax=Ethanoligenens harbinense (strain DSM 18485 / JCM 12961 / CGMCC 1.5033 / YUAN-3) TaxID=663278 RepID=E6U708_ETHHY|nr:imidazoleglycerol-phosphate dehydratase HisB [Ethanoligenens harbinense]ADU26975.1 Imidazoleglycerol-phosphate dehydratase [Ethanoligenens harbinense YUAN-3]AVQ96065.1 imidazoleglycerol-phosphate dehydratase HisB [Ethanoligenens harbinense YUAN-3]AYF38726.1 imidazoleglycerol-phosphate dehydratase HisB [Ethanoligenens harbinense]AYF41473.1 imidazoleglycerol-phosphate dehydratase HisB [Ethanoligenens harbinense]QCN92307.1 imidazoleglycerol-phosphate dehydratase HisB [Ethanoligenens harbinense
MRIGKSTRQTKETKIELSLNLDGNAHNDIRTGIGFFDHMLNSFATHAGFDLQVHVQGDLDVDGHHTVEDTGIVLGDTFAKAIGTKEGIARYGSFYVPMDEALAFCVLDISGRPFLVFDAPLQAGQIGAYDACLTEEFMRAFAFHAGITLHLRILYGKNTHHMTEGLFKALGHALRLACEETGKGVLSTKGSL